MHVCECVCLQTSAWDTRLSTFLLVQAYQRQVPTLVFLPAWYYARFQRLTRFCTLPPATHNSAILLFAHTYFGSPFQNLLVVTHKTRFVWFEPRDVLEERWWWHLHVIIHFIEIAGNPYLDLKITLFKMQNSFFIPYFLKPSWRREIDNQWEIKLINSIICNKYQSNY